MISGSGGGVAPKLAIAGFIPLSNDAETVAAAKTIADVLYDDIAYEREYYMIGKDAITSIPKPASIDSVPLDKWKEVNADGVIVGTVRKAASGIVVQVRLIKVATGESAFGKEYRERSPIRGATRTRSGTTCISSSCKAAAWRARG